MKNSAPLFLSLFFVGSLVGAYLHNWIITVAFSAALMVGYTIETAPVSKDPESDGFVPPEDDE